MWTIAYSIDLDCVPILCYMWRKIYQVSIHDSSHRVVEELEQIVLQQPSFGIYRLEETAHCCGALAIWIETSSTRFWVFCWLDFEIQEVVLWKIMIGSMINSYNKSVQIFNAWWGKIYWDKAWIEKDKIATSNSCTYLLVMWRLATSVSRSSNLAWHFQGIEECS